jgi:hypothetical protein
MELQHFIKILAQKIKEIEACFYKLDDILKSTSILDDFYISTSTNFYSNLADASFT